MVGLFGGANALILDDLLRKQGSSNPNVVRAAVTADDIAAYAGSGLAPTGKVLYIKDQYRNFLRKRRKGSISGSTISCATRQLAASAST